MGLTKIHNALTTDVAYTRCTSRTIYDINKCDKLCDDVEHLRLRATVDDVHNRICCILGHITDVICMKSEGLELQRSPEIHAHI